MPEVPSLSGLTGKVDAVFAPDGPLVHIIAAKAVCFKEAAEPAFAIYQKQIKANASARPASGSAR